MHTFREHLKQAKEVIGRIQTDRARFKDDIRERELKIKTEKEQKLSVNKTVIDYKTPEKPALLSKKVAGKPIVLKDFDSKSNQKSASKVTPRSLRH
jgi:hypothetical protein